MGAPQLCSNVSYTLIIISLFCGVDRQTDGLALLPSALVGWERERWQDRDVARKS